MNCKICEQDASLLFTSKVLGKYQVDYFKCGNCGFIQTEDPFWLEEAYSSAITALDLGLVQRNLVLRELIPKLIDGFFDPGAAFLDFGGGYGLLVRMLRDRGYNFYREDPMCENLFAKHFDLSDRNVQKFELLTAFEVFEHLNNPKKELEKMLNYSNNIFFTTTLQPEHGDLKEWDYLAPETGQHIAFYTRKSLSLLGQDYGLNYYHAGNYHLYTKQILSNDQLDDVLHHKSILERVLLKVERKGVTNSLLKSDYDLVLTNLTK